MPDNDAITLDEDLQKPDFANADWIDLAIKEPEAHAMQYEREHPESAPAK